MELTSEHEAAPDFPEVKARSDRVIEALNVQRAQYWARRAQAETDSRWKVIWLRRMAQTLEDAADGHVPCRSGCSHCCSIPVLLTHQEAEVIARETGRPMAREVPYTRVRDDKYTGTPCPFLAGNRCSIYEWRPIICRTHYSAEANADPCNLDQRRDVRYLNTRPFDHAYVLAFGESEIDRYADIRDFFPREIAP
jgi:Fe-S-cluster containining protein